MKPRTNRGAGVDVPRDDAERFDPLDIFGALDRLEAAAAVLGDACHFLATSARATRVKMTADDPDARWQGHQL
jgi:hypothetical protein